MYTSYIVCAWITLVLLCKTSFHLSRRTLLQAIIKGVWPFKYMELHCLIALKAKCRICKCSDFIACFMSCMLKYINTTIQAFTGIAGLICICLVIG